MKTKPVHQRIYCEARFDRGMGFGNRLFPWARCRIFSELHGIPMLAPRWVGPRIGPLFRGGIDLRMYHHQILLLGLFQRSNDYVSGFRRNWVLAWANRLEEPLDLAQSPPASQPKLSLYRFRGEKEQFQDLMRWHDFLRDQLRKETKHKWIELADKLKAPIALNVRCGNDFKDAVSHSDFPGKGPVKTPIHWFAACLKYVRQLLQAQVPAVVVSDGTAKQLAEILQLPNVHFARPGCAISDLLTLSEAKLLIGSGGSSFSAWGAFLSGAPTITHPGRRAKWFKLDESGRQNICEFDPQTEAQDVLQDSVRNALTRFI